MKQLSKGSASPDSKVTSLAHQRFAFYPASMLLFSCRHWDSSCRVTSTETGKLVQCLIAHRDVVTCVALAAAAGQHWLVTGSRDCTVLVFQLHPDRGEQPVDALPVHVLYGHDDTVTCLAVSAELDLVVSGSDDGTVIMHSLRSGAYIRTIVNDNQKLANPITPPAEREAARAKVTWVGVTNCAVITYAAEENQLCTFTINGRFLAFAKFSEVLHALLLSQDGKVLVTGGTSCRIKLRWVSRSFLPLIVWHGN